MNDQSPKKLDPDDQFARELERRHEELIASESGQSQHVTQNERNDDERIQSAMLVLEMLENLKPERPESVNVFAETVADPSTKADRPDDAGIRHETKIESVIPDLKQLGRFKIVEQIGRGGYGIVVRAYDLQLERDVAIKIPRFETALSPDSRLRFAREAKAAAALSHPAVVSVYETCSDQGVDFIVTELVDGENLATLLARGQDFSERAAAELVAQLADAVEHAHQRGVFHRDIKPSNILIENKQDALPKIADFGLASIIDQQDFTQSGAVVGTPAYMSPEQASGDKQAIGPHTDVYGLGAVLYQLLTGMSPFGDRSIVETLSAITSEDPRAPRQYDTSLSKDLEAICLKCLEKKPASRYSSARALQTDLRRFLDNSPVEARRITGFDRTVRWARRNPTLATVSTALLLALTIGLATTIILWRTSESHRQVAEQNQTRFQNKAEQLEEVVDGMFERIRQMPELGLHGMEPVRETMLADVNSYYSALLSETPADSGLEQKNTDTMLRLAAIKSSLSDNQGAIDVASRLLASIPASPTANQVQQKIDALMLVAVEHATLRQTARQQQCYDDAIELARDTFLSLTVPTDDDRIEFAKSLSEAADIVALWGDRTLSNELALESIQVWEEIPDHEVTDDETILALARSYVIAAKTHAASENRPAAQLYSERSIELIEQILDEQTRNSPRAQALLVDAFYTYGVSYRTELAKAIPQFDKAFLIASNLSIAHPLVPKYEQKIGSINYQRGLTHYVAFLVNKLALNRNDHLTSALTIFNDNINFLNGRRAQFPDDEQLFEPVLTSSVTMTGLIYGELEEYEDQIVSLEQSLSLAQQIYDESKSPESLLRVLGITGNLGFPYLKQKKYAQAIEQFELAIAGLEQTLQDDPENSTAARYLSGDFENLAKCFAAVDRHQDALNAYRKSMHAHREGKPDTMMGMEAVYLVHIGRYDEARTQFDQFVAHQIEKESLAKIVVHAGRMIGAVEDLPKSDHSETILSLKHQAVSAAVNALGDLDENTELDDSEIDGLLTDPDLSSLKATEAFQVWIEGRR